MTEPKIINISEFQKPSPTPRKRDAVNKNKKGSVYARGPKLWVSFNYMEERVREPSGLPDTEENRIILRRILDRIHLEIEEGAFRFQKRFPYSKKAAHFTQREGAIHKVRPEDILFSTYYNKWLNDMGPGMSINIKDDYCRLVKNHIMPFFGELSFSELNSAIIKRFISHLTTKELAPRSIHQIFNPLRLIVHDAISSYNFQMEPFRDVKLPRIPKSEIFPFTQNEWKKIMDNINQFYRSYFEFAVFTGLRPSEQVALKWTSIYEDRIEIESRAVRGRESGTMKTSGSRRTLSMRPELKVILDHQRKITGEKEYVFVNMRGKRIEQRVLSLSTWKTALKRASVPHRRMYETRHTFASWALASGEQPAWVARELGHTSLSMVYSVYGRFIPGFNGTDGKKLGTILGTINKTQSEDS